MFRVRSIVLIISGCSCFAAKRDDGGKLYKTREQCSLVKVRGLAASLIQVRQAPGEKVRHLSSSILDIYKPTPLPTPLPTAAPTQCATSFYCTSDPNQNTLRSNSCSADAQALATVFPDATYGLRCTNYADNSYNAPGDILRSARMCGFGGPMSLPADVTGISITCSGFLNDPRFGDGRSVTLDNCADNIDAFNQLACSQAPAPTPACNHDWHLLHSGWIDSYVTQLEPSFLKLGQFVSPDEESISYQQVYLECASTSSGVQRVLTLAAIQTTAKPSNLSIKEEIYYSKDYNASRPADFSWGGGWNEEHTFGPSRFIVRVSNIHCVKAVSLVGGSDNNPSLGQYGRVWVRQNTATPSEADLPTCLPQAKIR